MVVNLLRELSNGFGCACSEHFDYIFLTVILVVKQNTSHALRLQASRVEPSCFSANIGAPRDAEQRATLCIIVVALKNELLQNIETTLRLRIHPVQGNTLPLMN